MLRNFLLSQQKYDYKYDYDENGVEVQNNDFNNSRISDIQKRFGVLQEILMIKGIKQINMLEDTTWHLLKKIFKRKTIERFLTKKKLFCKVFNYSDL